MNFRILLVPGKLDSDIFSERLLEGVKGEVVIMDREYFENLIGENPITLTAVDGVIIKMIPYLEE